MPELPEVETVVRMLNERLPGKVIEGIHFHDAAMLKHITAPDFSSTLTGAIITEVKRRGKFILILLKKKEMPFTLAVHLRMTGNLIYYPEILQKEIPYTRVIINFSHNKGHLVFTDIRKFGTMEIIFGPRENEFYANLGLEPLNKEFTEEAFSKLLLGKKSPIKSFLLNQKYICGIGNIYADEILYISGIHPERPLDSLTHEEIKGLWKAIPAILRQGIRAGGTTTRDYRNADGEAGGFQNLLQVYQKAGVSCPKCKTSIQKIKVAGRGSYFCPCCQFK